VAGLKKFGGSLMGRYGLFTILSLAAIWIVLVEHFTWASLAVALFMAVFCTYFSDMFLPPAKEAKTVNFKKLIFYPIYILGQVYAAAFVMIKFIIVGANVDMVTVKTSMKSEVLKVLLMDSMTFVPGSISLDLNDDTIKMLWIYDKKIDKDKLGKEKVSDILKGGMEKRLARAELFPEGGEK